MRVRISGQWSGSVGRVGGQGQVAGSSENKDRLSPIELSWCLAKLGNS